MTPDRPWTPAAIQPSKRPVGSLQGAFGQHLRPAPGHARRRAVLARHGGDPEVEIGLVLLGTRIIFSDILEAGSLGLIQAIIVVLTVWYFAFWICKKFKLDDELNMMISSAVSICGVSAAIATAGAIKGE